MAKLTNAHGTPYDAQGRDGTLYPSADYAPPGSELWHPECSAPDDYANPGAVEGDCPQCGAPEGEPCRPMGGGCTCAECDGSDVCGGGP